MSKSAMIFRKIYLWFICFALTNATFAQNTKITWEQLADVKFSKRYVKEQGIYFKFPRFGQSVLPLNGTQVSIKGYLLPFDAANDVYVVSAKPMASCYFCGGSGPESIIELRFKTPNPRFKTDEIRTIKGILKTNPDDINHLCYIMEQAEVE
jgi:hypothetical protein